MVNLSNLISQYPDAIASPEKLRGYLLDLYPDEKKAIINVLVSCLECGIVDDIKNQSSVDSFAKDKYITRLCNDYGFAKELSSECVTTWIIAFDKAGNSNDNVDAQTYEDVVGTILESPIEECTYNPDDFEINKNNGVLTGYYGKQKHVVIPSSVTEIGRCAFSYCTSLTSVTIPDSVIEIGEDAFRDCASLTSVTIPDSVIEIGEEAFCGCASLTSIIIPNSVTKIGEEAFCGCTSLTSVTIPGSVTEISASAFRECTSLTSVTIPDSVTEIGRDAFRGCTSLTSVTIPGSVTKIGRDAFFDCRSLINLLLPKSLQNINLGSIGLISDNIVLLISV